MKYIRTKDKISVFGTEYTVKLPNDKLADTIEELCDEFVWLSQIRPMLIKIPKKLSQNQLEDIKNGMIVYGAIWTDKGLIYVAKMNEKGGWELL